MKSLSMTLFAIMLAVVLLPGCSKESSGAADKGDKRKMRFPVQVVEVTTQPVTYTINAVGSVEPFEIVQVTARVAGVVDKVSFIEGATVRTGQVLVEVDAERYQLAVTAARASLAKAQAAQADAEKGLERREGVIARNPGLLPGEELETWRTKVQTAKADAALADAALKQAEINFRDARVKAPISGVIQSRTVQTGQYVQEGTVLATLVRRDPLLMKFKVPEQEAERLALGGPVKFLLNNQPEEYSAKITFIASTADPTSRMVDVTSQVNDSHVSELRPGSFTEVHVPVGETRELPVIPLTSIRASEHGFIAYVLDGDTAHERILTLGLRTADGKVEVLSGVNKGEKLVERGSEALREGAMVVVTFDSTRTAPPAPRSTPGGTK